MRLCGADEPGRDVLHGVVHAAPVHDAAGAPRAAAGRPGRQPPRRHAARDAEDVRLSHGQYTYILEPGRAVLHGVVHATGLHIIYLPLVDIWNLTLSQYLHTIRTVIVMKTF